MGEETLSQSRKRKTANAEEILAKRARNHVDQEEEEMENELYPGKIKRILLRNFMCHEALEMNFNSRLNFLVGVNGSGKSAILTALTVGLGANAKETDRGSSLKSFVKQGKNSATIEITVTNRGNNAYNWETYGDTITIVRNIGATSGYKMKSHHGEIISTKKEEFLQIIKALHIQVNNPISVLNQDAARSFLLSRKPQDLYRFYMKSSTLEEVRGSIANAIHVSEHAKLQLDRSTKHLRGSEKIIKELEGKIHALESLDKHKQEYEELQKEVFWAEVIAEEKKLLQIDKKIDHENSEIEKLENIESTKAAKEKEINSQIEDLKAEIAKMEAEAASSKEESENMKKKAMSLRKLVDEQREKTSKFHKNIKDKESDLQLLLKEIKDREQEECDLDGKRQEAQRQIEEWEQQLNEVQTTLKTKRTDLLHLEENKSRIDQEDKNFRIEIDQKRMELNKQKQKLQHFQNQPNDALNVYGQNFPRLVRRIEEEHQRGRFQKKPIGPLGSFISIKEQQWSPAIEAHIGATMLKTFCVDNHHDKAILNRIMTEIFTNEAPPSIITSKFFDRVHNVSNKSTRSPRYQNILEMMNISNATVANTLIDQRQIERIILIPTSEEASTVMDDFRKVPQNCKKAITLVNDLFFPDPDYRSYGGNARRARFLQVSSEEAIQRIRDDIDELENQIHFQKEQYAQIQQRKQKTYQEHSQVQQQVRKLVGHESTLRKDIEENRDILESHSNNLINEHKLEVEHIKEWLETKKKQESQMMDEYRALDKDYQNAAADFKICRQLTANLDVTLNPIKEQIHELKDELKRLDVTNTGANKRLQEAKQVVQRLKGEHAQQQRVVTTKTATAKDCCPRIESKKTVNQIIARSRELKKFIEEVEKEHGDKEALQEELKIHQQDFVDVYEKAVQLEDFKDFNDGRIIHRRGQYYQMKDDVITKVQRAFSNILSLRNYKGEVLVDHTARTIHLEMAPMNDAKRCTNDAKQLSGGERSYSTIAFILALWSCADLPFYFLDEFDVFMDKINRRMVMDILIQHAQNHPESQFTFLTPLDASHIKACSTITIHRMAPPERLG